MLMSILLLGIVIDLSRASPQLLSKSQSYQMKLWGCNTKNHSSVPYNNQRWHLDGNRIVFTETGGCLTSSSTSTQPGSALHVASCVDVCTTEQNWTVKHTHDGHISIIGANGTCVGAQKLSVPLPSGLAEWAVTSQNCNGADPDVLLLWDYNVTTQHFTTAVPVSLPNTNDNTNGNTKTLCLDAGSGVVPGTSSPSSNDRSDRMPFTKQTQNKTIPSGQGCATELAKTFPYCNTSLSTKARITDLLQRMTVEEKTIHLLGSGTHIPNGTFPSIPRLGLPSFDWGLEGQHGLRLGCYIGRNPSTCPDPNSPSSADVYCPTVFPAPTGLGSTFNDSLIRSIGNVIGTEARAVNNLGTQEDGRLVVRTPVINLIRDPRWGRNVECPTEDPLHAGMYGAAMISGVQTQDQNGRLLAGVEMKHFAVYQVEDCGGAGVGPGIPSDLPKCSRMSFNAVISQSELNETYFVPFKTAVQMATTTPTGYMCSYNAINGVPACANSQLSETIKSWGFDGYCGTDCSAADGIYTSHNYTKDLPHAYAAAINGGTDLICSLHNISALYTAVSTGLISSVALDLALSHAFGVLFKLGVYDPVDDQPFTNIGIETLQSRKHVQLSLEAARQSTVLLRNRNSALPFAVSNDDKSSIIAVIGPQGNATGQIGGNYFNNECPDGTVIWEHMSGGGGQDNWWSCVPTVYQAVTKIAKNLSSSAQVFYAQGCEQRCSGNTSGAAKDIDSKQSFLNPDECNAADSAGIAAAVKLAMKADLVVLALGFDTAIAGEGHDRLDISLPGAQQQLALQVLSAVSQRNPRPKVVLTLLAGSSISIDRLLQGDANTCLDAIIIGHQPGLTGGTAVAEAIFGLHNDFGKLSYTVYPHAYQNETSLIDMSFRTPPGRTHRFYTGTPLFSYGQGMSFTSFKVTKHAGSPNFDNAINININTTESIVIDGHGRGKGNETYIHFSTVLQNIGRRAGSEVLFVWFLPSSQTQRETLTARLGQPPPKQILVAYRRSHTLVPTATQRTEFTVKIQDFAYVIATPTPTPTTQGTTTGTLGGSASPSTSLVSSVRRVLPAGHYSLRVDRGPQGEFDVEGNQTENVLTYDVHVEHDVEYV